MVPLSLVDRKPSVGAGAAGNRPRLVPLAVPDSVPFAARRMRQEAEEREEKARLKERVLEMHKAQKEADETSRCPPDQL